MWQVAARMMKTADPAATVKTNAPQAQAPRMRPTAALSHSGALRPPAFGAVLVRGSSNGLCCSQAYFESIVMETVPGLKVPSVAVPSITIIERFPSSSHGRAVLAAAADIVSWGCGGWGWCHRGWWVVGLVRRGSCRSCSNGVAGPPAALVIGGGRPMSAPVTVT